jgi:hypothetical protein
MATKLIRMDDGTLVEVVTDPNQPEQISSRVADRVGKSLDQVEQLLVDTCRPVVAAWRELNKEMHIDEAEIELGLSFEGSGDIYITKFQAGANLKVTLKLKPAAGDAPDVN